MSSYVQAGMMAQVIVNTYHFAFAVELRDYFGALAPAAVSLALHASGFERW